MPSYRKGKLQCREIPVEIAWLLLLVLHNAVGLIVSSPTVHVRPLDRSQACAVRRAAPTSAPIPSSSFPSPLLPPPPLLPFPRCRLFRSIIAVAVLGTKVPTRAYTVVHYEHNASVPIPTVRFSPAPPFRPISLPIVNPDWLRPAPHKP